MIYLIDSLLSDNKCNGNNTLNIAICCSNIDKCTEGGGDCDFDFECAAGLKCGDNNCINFPNSQYDCCYKPSGIV